MGQRISEYTVAKEKAILSWEMNPLLAAQQASCQLNEVSHLPRLSDHFHITVSFFLVNGMI
jgi:hypothetical protein